MLFRGVDLLNKHVLSVFLITLMLITPFSIFTHVWGAQNNVNKLTKNFGSFGPTEWLSETSLSQTYDNAQNMFQSQQIVNTFANRDISISVEDLVKKSDIDLVKDSEGNINLLLIMNSAARIEELEGKGRIDWIAPIGNGKILLSVYAKEDLIDEMLKIPSLIAASPNFKLINTRLQKVDEYKYLRVSEDSSSKDNNWLLDSEVIEILNAQTSLNLGFNGSGITIAVVDTGVDFAAEPLLYKYDVQDDKNVISFVPDGDCAALTPYVLTSFDENGSKFLPTANRTFEFYDGFFGDVYTITLRENYNITGITSLSGNYHLGFIIEWIPYDIYYYGFVTPVLVTDSNTPNVYDTVWVDITFSLYYYATTLGYPYKESWLDYKFEGPYQLDANNLSATLVAVDIYNTTIFDNGTIATELGEDGYLDYSLGIIGVPFIDSTGGVSSFLSSVGVEPRTYYSGIDPNGNWVGFLYDFMGHGTSVATSAAGNPTTYKIYYTNDSKVRNITITGLSPGAKIMGVRALSWGKIIEGWLYAAGFDLTTNSNLSSQIWTYTGKHKAEIISNSWGISKVWTEYGYKMYSSDIMSIVETALSLNGTLLTQEIYSDPVTEAIYNASNLNSYVPSLFVHAAGNGGPGYGTANIAPYSPLALQVGASTSFHWRPVYTNETRGTADQIAWWSGRGPIVSGFGGPDVIAVGAYAFEAIPPAIAGSGSIAIDLFGGTSQATPIAAGAAAIVLQAFNSTFSFWTPAIIKSLIMLGARKLSFDPFTMGTGIIDVNKSLSLALNSTNYADLGYVSTDFVSWYLNTFLNITGPIGYKDAGLPYINAGFIKPGGKKTISLQPYDFLGDSDNIWSVKATVLYLTSARRLYFYLDPAYKNFTTPYGNYYLFDLEKQGVFIKNYDFARITVYFTKSEYLHSGVSYAALWSFSSGVVDEQSDISLVNRFTGYGNIMTVEVSNPSEIPGNLAIGFHSLSSEKVGVRVLIQMYKRIDSQNLSFSYTNDKSSIDVTVNVNSDTLPGTYWAFLNITNYDLFTIFLPIMYHVVIDAKTGSNLTLTNTYLQFNDTVTYEKNDAIEPNGSKNITINIKEKGFYRFIMDYSNVSVEPEFRIMDENETVLGEGTVSGLNQLFTWLEISKIGNYVIEIKNLDKNILSCTLTVVKEGQQLSLGLDNSTMPQYSFINGYDWGWRSEVGEWRFYYIAVNDSSLINVTVTWEEPGTDAYIQVYHYNSGDLLMRHVPNYITSGLYGETFYKSSSLVFPATNNSLYVIAIHAPLLSGVAMPDKFNVSINVVKHVGPYIKITAIDEIVQRPNDLRLEFEISSVEFLEEFNFTINNVPVTPTQTTLSILNKRYWNVKTELPIHSLLEGRNNVTIYAYDSKTSTYVTKTFYIDATPPSLSNIYVNGKVYEGEPVKVTSTQNNLNITLEVADETPLNGTIEILNTFNESITTHGYFKFDINKGKFVKTMNIVGWKSIYLPNKGKWFLNITISLQPMYQAEGYYALNLNLTDYLNQVSEINVLNLIAMDLTGPTISDLELFEGEPTKTIFVKSGTISQDQVNHTINLESGATYNLYLTWDNKYTDLDLYVYDPYGYLVALSANYGYAPENVTFTAKIDGQYTITIERYFGQDTDYQLTVREIHKLIKVEAVGSKSNKTTFSFKVLDVSLSSIDFILNGVKLYTLTPINATIIAPGVHLFTVTINSSLLSSGSNVLNITATDSNSLTTKMTFNILRDNVEPTIYVLPDLYVREYMVINVTYYDNETGVRELRFYLNTQLWKVYKVDGDGEETFVFDVANLTEGTYILKVVAIDGALNEASSSFTFYLDKTPPVLSLIDLVNGSYIGEKTKVYFAVIDNVKVSAVRVYVNGTIYRVLVAEENVSLYHMLIDLSNFPGNGVSIQFLVFDMAGNTRAVTYIFKIDRDLPIVYIYTPNYTMIRDFVINVTVVDENFRYAEIYIDNSLVATMQDNNSILIPIIVKNYADGIHNVTVIAYDTAGNAVEEIATFSTSYYQNRIYNERSKLYWYAIISIVAGVAVGFLIRPVLAKRIRKGKN